MFAKHGLKEGIRIIVSESQIHLDPLPGEDEFEHSFRSKDAMVERVKAVLGPETELTVQLTDHGIGSNHATWTLTLTDAASWASILAALPLVASYAKGALSGAVNVGKSLLNWRKAQNEVNKTVSAVGGWNKIKGASKEVALLECLRLIETEYKINPDNLNIVGFYEINGRSNPMPEGYDIGDPFFSATVIFYSFAFELGDSVAINILMDYALNVQSKTELLLDGRIHFGFLDNDNMRSEQVLSMLEYLQEETPSEADRP